MSINKRSFIELQNVSQLYFKDLSIFYASFPIQEQAPKGKDWDYYLKAIYTIGILNFSFPDPSGKEWYLREVGLLDKETFEVFYEKLTFIYLEMPKFRKSEEELVTHFDKWMDVLKNLPKLQARPVKLQEKVFEKLFNAAEIAKLTQEEMRTYEESLKTYRDNYSVLDTAKREREIEIAKRLKQKGVDIEIISETTGLSKEQIEKL